MSDAPPLFAGINAAVLTPLKDDLSPDHTMLVRHCRWLLDNGCDGLGILGTTGEANSFSMRERIDIIEAVVKADVPTDRLMPGTGCCSLTESVTLTRVALEAGCKGVLMLPPFYYKNVSDDGLFAYFSTVIERVADPKARVYLYHFPQMSAVPFSHDLIERLLRAFPGVVRGVKDSSGDVANMKAMVARFPGFEVYTGSDEFLLPLLRAGGAGGITAASNINCRVGAKVFAGFKSPEADRQQEILTATRRVTTSVPPISGLKEIMARITGIAGWRNIRPPHLRLAREKADELYAKLLTTGVELPKAA
ncbi:MAG: dihydrodipicolinate synthase family protein [Proteobacteria bacterium]|nr:dihydrodipicolinate synthase family protein [Pseudomonadota bacterium]